MSGVVATLAGSSSGRIVNPLSAMSINHVVASPAIASGDISLDSSGGISGTPPKYSGPSLYFMPAISGIGSNYWVKFVKNSGSVWNAGLVDGTLYQLNATRTLDWSVSSGTKTANVSVSIYSDSGGTNLMTSGTLSVVVDSS